MTDAAVVPILVAACGNLLAGDDAFGPLVARALAGRCPSHVEVIDLGMRPAGLLDHLAGRRALILVDAARMNDGRAGELLDLDFFAPGRPDLCADRTTSTHAFSIAGQLELARTLGMLPPVVRLVALLIEEPRLGTLGEIAWAGIDPAVALILRRISALC